VGGTTNSGAAAGKAAGAGDALDVEPELDRIAVQPIGIQMITAA